MSGNRFVMADTGLTGNTFHPSRWGERPERMRTLDRHDFIMLPDGKATQIGHVLAGLESARFGPSTVGGVEFDHPRTATTWSGDLGQAVFVAKTYGGNKADWEKARLEAAPEVEMFGDLHGDVLGRDWASQLGAKKLSRVLEEYFYDPRRDPKAQASFLGEYGMSKGDLRAAAQGQGLGKLATARTHIESFAETWDSNKWDDFNAETDAAIVDFSLTYLAEQLLALDP